MMFGPLNDIGSASGLLGTALKQYLALCSILDPRAGPIPKTLSHLIETELLALDSYEVMIRQAKSALGRAKNSCSTIVPINSLPPEILSRIFTLAMDGSCWGYEQDRSLRKFRFPRYPDVLLHVCYRWRQVATSSCKLWSHIDIIPRYVSTTGLLTRVEALVALTGQSPLELHIGGAVDPKSDPDARYLSNPETPLLRLVSSIAPRLQSLEFTTHVFEDFHLSILKTCIMNCTPGTLTRLIIQPLEHGLSSSGSLVAFLEATEMASGFNGRLRINKPQEDLEALLLPIKTLDLYGIYPPWSSKAYHGLVELRLPGLSANPASGIEIVITEAQLVGILQSSPQLRVFHLGIEVGEPLPEYASITPVCLNNLEVLDFSSSRFSQHGTILRWIASGPNPPMLALEFGSWQEEIPDDDTRQFLARSRTTKLAVSGPDSNEWPPNLLSLAPHLQTLVFRNLGYYGHEDREPPPFPEEHGLPPDFRPNYLHVMFCGCFIEFGWLQRVLGRRPIHCITLWGSNAYRYGKLLANDEVKSELLQVCPVVRILGFNEPNPAEDWDLHY